MVIISQLAKFTGLYATGETKLRSTCIGNMAADTVHTIYNRVERNGTLDIGQIEKSPRIRLKSTSTARGVEETTSPTNEKGGRKIVIAMEYR
jgi:hypothetical protein